MIAPAATDSPLARIVETTPPTTSARSCVRDVVLSNPDVRTG
jgi:hypothetical protein